MPANMATQSANQPATQPAMMPTDIKSIKEIMPKTMPADVVAQAKHIPARVADEAFSMGKFDVFDQSFDKGYMEYDNDQPAIGLDVLKAQTTALRAAMPDLKATSNPIVSEGDWIAFEFTYGGTFKNALTSPDGQSLPPTGKPLQSTAILFAQINDQGKVTSVYLRSDDLSFLRQIAVIKQ